MAHPRHSDDRNASVASAARTRHESVCAICLESTANSPLVSLSPCRHSFCRPCIEQWALHLAAASSSPSGPATAGTSARARRQNNPLVAPSSATCPLCKSRFTDGVALTPTNMSYGVALPAVKWRLPVTVAVARVPAPSSMMAAAAAVVANDSDRARLAASTNPLDDPIWRNFPGGYRSRLAECRRHLVYHAWWTSGHPSESMNAATAIAQQRSVSRRAASQAAAAAAVAAWIERDVRAVYHAILLGAPHVPVDGGARQGDLATYDAVLVRVAKDLIVSLMAAAAAAAAAARLGEDDGKLDRLVQVLQLPSIRVAEKLVAETVKFAESGLGMDVYDAMACREAGVPTLVEMAKRDYEQSVSESEPN